MWLNLVPPATRRCFITSPWHSRPKWQCQNVITSGGQLGWHTTTQRCESSETCLAVAIWHMSMTDRQTDRRETETLKTDHKINYMAIIHVHAVFFSALILMSGWWNEGHHRAHKKILHHLFLKILFLNKWRMTADGKPVNPGSPGKNAVKHK